MGGLPPVTPTPTDPVRYDETIAKLKGDIAEQESKAKYGGEAAAAAKELKVLKEDLVCPGHGQRKGQGVGAVLSQWWDPRP